MNGIKNENALAILFVHAKFRKNLERKRKTETMKNEFTAIIERDGDWFIAYCPEIPEANGQGKTREEARKSLADGIALLFENRQEDCLRNLSPGTIQERVVLS